MGNLSRLQVGSSTLVSIGIVTGIEIFFVQKTQHVVLCRMDCLTFTDTKTTAIFYTIERLFSTRYFSQVQMLYPSAAILCQ